MSTIQRASFTVTACSSRPPSSPLQAACATASRSEVGSQRARSLLRDSFEPASQPLSSSRTLDAYAKTPDQPDQGSMDNQKPGYDPY